MTSGNNGGYDDIINLPFHVSKKHTQMTVRDRAAQFAAFAALTGYSDEIGEEARLTELRVELDEGVKAELDAKLRLLSELAAENPNEKQEITVTYFKPDVTKTGGEYITVGGKFKKIDDYNGDLVMEDKTRLPIESITKIEGSFCEKI